MKKITLVIFLLTLCLFFADHVSAQLQTFSNIVNTKVGNPVSTNSSGWPINVSSRIEQGPAGTFDHYRLYAQGLQALDISNSVGTPVFTTMDGTVTTVCNDAQTSCGEYTGCNENGCGYGKHVVVSSTVGGKSMTTFFGHFSQISVEQGQTVKKGDQVGLMGTTGFSTGPHVHWEFRGIPMAPPNIPVAITPLDCDYPSSPCSPGTIPTADTNTTQPTAQGSYWFILHRQSNKEDLYNGAPGNTNASTLVRSFTVKVGSPDRPTPLPQLFGKEYWVITEKHPETAAETAPYFLSLNIPHDAPFFGPYPYNECGGQQCNWQLPGAFGLHGVNGDNSRLAADNPGSSGCIRHSNEDITYLYNTLDPSSSEIRYYIQDN